MDDPDLTAYLDGEAEPALAERMAGLLRSDPQLRIQALALLRQQVLLTRVLPTLTVGHPSPRSHPLRRWPLVVPLLAAATAAIVVMAVIVSRPADASPTVAPAMPAPVVQSPHQPDPTPSAGSWNPGRVIEAGADVPNALPLDDGAVLTIAPMGAVVVPASGQPWELQRGGVSITMPTASSALSYGVITTQALVTPTAGRFVIKVQDDGTHVQCLAGSVVVRDQLTSASVTVASGSVWWIPADTTDALAAVANQQGEARGTVLAVKGNGGAFTLRTRFGIITPTPDWIGGKDGGLDPTMTAQIARLHVGDRIMITWRHTEHLRVLAIHLIAAAAVTSDPPAGDDAF